MPHDSARRTRLPPNKYRYRPLVSKNVEYVFVDNGFFRLANVGPSIVNPLNLFNAVLCNLMTFYSLYLAIVTRKWYTLFYLYFVSMAGALGLTAGVHRLWSHRTYDAHWSVRVFLMLIYCSVPHGSLFEWARGHRVHHKFSDTDADPINPLRGMVFAHAGFFLTTEHPDVARAEAKIPGHDLMADPVIRFQHRYSTPLMYIMTILILVVQMVFLDNTFLEAFATGVCTRFNFTSQSLFLINSAAHFIGHKPYKSDCSATENNLVHLVSIGEGHHNYHHAFPFDYRTGEGIGAGINITQLFIELCAKLGLAWNLKTASPNLIKVSLEKIDGQKQNQDLHCH